MPPECNKCGKHYWNGHLCDCGKTPDNQDETVQPDELTKVDIEVGAAAILLAMKRGKATDGSPCDRSNFFMDAAFVRFAKACAESWGLSWK